MKLGETESRRGRELLIIDAGANIGAAALYFPSGSPAAG